jgi:hypothetical protein
MSQHVAMIPAPNSRLEPASMLVRIASLNAPVSGGAGIRHFLRRDGFRRVRDGVPVPHSPPAGIGRLQVAQGHVPRRDRAGPKNREIRDR